VQAEVFGGLFDSIGLEDGAHLAKIAVAKSQIFPHPDGSTINKE
jgi:hypothetical protein